MRDRQRLSLCRVPVIDCWMGASGSHCSILPLWNQVGLILGFAQKECRGGDILGWLEIDISKPYGIHHSLREPRHYVKEPRLASEEKDLWVRCHQKRMGSQKQK